MVLPPQKTGDVRAPLAPPVTLALKMRICYVVSDEVKTFKYAVGFARQLIQKVCPQQCPYSFFLRLNQLFFYQKSSECALLESCIKTKKRTLVLPATGINYKQGNQKKKGPNGVPKFCPIVGS